MENNNISKAIKVILDKIDKSNLSERKKADLRGILNKVENTSISKALIAFNDSKYEIGNVDGSILSETAKNAVNRLLEILCLYYVERYLELNMEQNEYRLTEFSSQMTDYIVTINDTIKGKNDAFCVANAIYKEINYDEGKGKFKRKRLI